MAALAGCDRRSDLGPVTVSVIGEAPQLVAPSRRSIGEPSRQLMQATAQGLVRFDAAGQVEPGLAARWIVIDDGMSYIFRLRDARWADGEKVTADAVVARLRAAIAPGSRNPLKSSLGAIDEIVEMTPEVIEVRLRSPRPELLKLFAQPELAIFDLKTLDGSGPFEIAERDRRSVTLTPTPSLDDPPEAGAEVDPRETVILHGERAARAIARFVTRQSDMVTGGTFADWPLLDQVEIDPASLRVEQVAGLFGLAIVEREGFLAAPEDRAAIAMAIDRAALVEMLGPSWQAETAILPEQYESARPPVPPAWISASPNDRRLAAAARVAVWRAANGDPPALRLALPDGPGSNLVFARIAADLRAIGLTVERVDESADADLRLIDMVAPHDNARWFLMQACRLCSEVPSFALEAARDAPTMADRAARIAEADAAVTADAAFIPLARPLRWSLVSQRLRQWTANPRGVHPLNHLRADTN
ncbi:ABC transporter substrate-binding protein [Sphingomonas gilva]|nr:ABC transporter substrate-binding protein [Sphingomonas gilva]